MSVLRFDDPRGDLAYPFLPAFLQWEIHSRSFSAEGAVEDILSADPPTLRWVKDDKVMDLVVPGMDTAAFLTHSDLQLSMHNGGYVLSKRLSRIMRPYRFWEFFADDEVTIRYNADLDGRLWDGSGQVSLAFVQKLADRLELMPRHRRELLQTRRFEVTTLHAGGQDKGHVHVVENLTVDGVAVDFHFPAGSAKWELALTDPSARSTSLSRSGQSGRIFIGLQPVHSSDQMCLDIQSLINLHPFFQPEHLLAWSVMESGLFLDGIRSGRLAGLLNRLDGVDAPEDLAALSDWHVGEYIASGGSLMWFAGMVKAVGKQHLRRLGSREEKLRFPIPGGRYYIAPAAVGNLQVPRGDVMLDPAAATAWVNDTDWSTFIVDILGGCDGDDGVWVFPFADLHDGGAQKLLLWRSPNQLGEYVLLRPAACSHELSWQIPGGSLNYPKMKSRLLPNRIDSGNYQYGLLQEVDELSITDASYSIGAMASTVIRAAANQGVLGGYCNVGLLCKAVYGRLPQQLPASLEAVIDGSVKTGLDLTPVKQWNQTAVTRMVRHGQLHPTRALPAALVNRLPAWLRERAADSAARRPSRHWLDTLVNAIDAHKSQYWAEVEALAAEACPPLALFEQGRDWLAEGKGLRRAYSRVLRQELGSANGAVEADGRVELAQAEFAAARVASERYLAQWPAAQQSRVLLGAAAYLYMQGPQNGAPVRDGLLWQLGEVLDTEAEHGRAPGIAQQMLTALREVGLLGEPVWTDVGAVLYYREEPAVGSAGVPVTLRGTWFNWLNSRNGRRYTRMSEVPAAERERAKARIADFVQERFRGLLLTTEVTDGNRVVTRTPHGNLFGYVQKDHELTAIRYDQWRIAWAHAVDGNVMALLEPAV